MEASANTASGTASSARWSTIGRRSVRNLTALLKRGSNGGASGSAAAKQPVQQQQQQQEQQQQQQHLRNSNRLSMLDNNCVAGWNCIDPSSSSNVAVKQISKPTPQPYEQQQPPREPSKIRTTVLGCPKRLRSSMPSAARKQAIVQPTTAVPTAPTAFIAPSPLFEIRRQHRTGSSRLRADVDENADAGDYPSLVLELNGQQSRLKHIGRRLSSPADVWALFASQWPATVQSLGSHWRIQLQRSDWPSTCWQTISGNDSAIHPLLRRLPTESRLRMESTTSGASATGCSCECTCKAEHDAAVSACGRAGDDNVQGGGSRHRIERLESQVTSIARQLERRRLRLTNLRDECRQLRSDRDALRLEHDSRMRETRQMFSSLSSNVQRILSGWSVKTAASCPTIVISSEERSQVDAELQSYRLEGEEVCALLDDVDATTSELRHDVLKRRCRTSAAEVELLALHLSRATQRLASLKNRFPELESRTRDLLDREAEIVAGDERQLTEEQQRLETWLRRVKKLTMMLYTFKQLAEAQAKEAETAEPRPLVLLRDSMTGGDGTSEGDRRNLLRNIASVCPDHNRRLAEISRAEAAIQRRQRMIREAAALKAEKTLTAAAGRLKPVRTGL